MSVPLRSHAHSKQEVTVKPLSFAAELWLYHGDAAWHFVTLPPDVADEIEAQAVSNVAFGSVPVEVTIGATTWSTSLFPDSKTQSYVLPVKKEVRRREGLLAGSPVTVHLSLRET